MSDMSHTVVRLAVHLPLEHNVMIHNNDPAQALENASDKNTTLTAWFELNSRSEEAREILYSEIPQHYVFKDYKWKRRERNANKTLSRMYHVSPRDIERYCLRMLLLHVPGACSFENLRTVNGHTYGSFKEACIALDIFSDDTEWHNALTQASLLNMPYQIRQLFVTILIFCCPKDPLLLWHEHSHSMLEDFLHNGMTHEQATTAALSDIDISLGSHGKSCRYFGLPEPTETVPVDTDQQEAHFLRDAISLEQLNVEQRTAADAILEELQNNQRNAVRLYFLDGPGGSGD